MRTTGKGIAIGSWACACVLALSACGGAAEDAELPRATVSGSPVDPALYSGDVSFRVAETLAAGDRDIPFALYLGLEPAAGTRLAAKGLVDLRDLQDGEGP